MNMESFNSFFNNIKRVDLLNVSIALVLVVYSLIFRQDYERIKTKIISGELNEKPAIEKFGGDFDYYKLIMSIKGYDEEFVVNWCHFKALDQSKINKMRGGNKLILEVKENSPYQVIGIKYGDIEIINKAMAQRCFNSSWKKNGVLFMIGIAFLLIPIIRNLVQSRAFTTRAKKDAE